MPAVPLTPMLLASGDALPKDTTRHVMEPNVDGVRVTVSLRADRPPAWRSRHGTDLSGLAPQVDAALLELPAGTVLDGELIALAAGASGGAAQDFARVRRAVFGRRPDPGLALVVWDVLMQGGEDVRARPWDARRTILEALMAPVAGPVLVSPAWEPATERLQALNDGGWEGAVVKRRAAPYRSGERTRDWTKLKARHHEAAVMLERLEPEPGGPPRARVQLADGAVQVVLVRADCAAGDPVEVAFSRRDVDGSLREARVTRVLDRAGA